MQLELTPTQRSALRTRAHALHTVIMVGNAGLTPAVLAEIVRALASRELIKIRVLSGERAARAALLSEICDALEAAPVQHIGKILVVFRPRREDDAARAPKPKIRRKAPRRTKRSFQR